MLAIKTSALSGGGILVGELREVRPVFGVLDGDAANVTIPINVEQRVFIQVAGLGHFRGAKLDVQRVGVLKILDLHGLNERSKKAL